MNVFIRNHDDRLFCVNDATPDITVGDLKSRISKKIGVPVTKFRLEIPKYYCFPLPSDSTLISTCGITDMSTVRIRLVLPSPTKQTNDYDSQLSSVLASRDSGTSLSPSYDPGSSSGSQQQEIVKN